MPEGGRCDVIDAMVFDEDSILAVKVRKGDRRSFEALLDKYERPLFSFIHNFFREWAICEDLAQETFLRAYRFIGSYRPDEKFSTWLFSIARNLCIDELRRRKKGTTVDIETVEPDHLAADGRGGRDPQLAAILGQQGEVLRTYITRLPEKYRTCIILFYFNELSYDEISSIMNISLNNTKITLFRGKKMLLEMYRKETGEEV